MIPLRDDQPSFSTPFINYFLIVLNVLVFLWELSIGLQSDRALNAFIGEFGVVPRHTVAVLTGHSYDSPATALLPFFTSMFLHGGFLHIAGNMLFLAIFGPNVEDAVGYLRYIVFYLLGGLVALAAQVLVNRNSMAPTLGASGAIAAVLGGYILLYPRARVLTLIFIVFFVTIVELPAVFVLGFWFLEQLYFGAAGLVTPVGGASGVATFAHIGGFLFGLALIRLFTSGRKPEAPRLPVY